LAHLTASPAGTSDAGKAEGGGLEGVCRPAVRLEELRRNQFSGIESKECIAHGYFK
jgi:hypothetical protein